MPVIRWLLMLALGLAFLHACSSDDEPPPATPASEQGGNGGVEDSRAGRGDDDSAGASTSGSAGEAGHPSSSSGAAGAESDPMSGGRASSSSGGSAAAAGGNRGGTNSGGTSAGGALGTAGTEETGCRSNPHELSFVVGGTGYVMAPWSPQADQGCGQSCPCASRLSSCPCTGLTYRTCVEIIVWVLTPPAGTLRGPFYAYRDFDLGQICAGCNIEGSTNITIVPEDDPLSDIPWLLDESNHKFWPAGTYNVQFTYGGPRTDGIHCLPKSGFYPYYLSTEVTSPLCKEPGGDPFGAGTLAGDATVTLPSFEDSWWWAYDDQGTYLSCQ